MFNGRRMTGVIVALVFATAATDGLAQGSGTRCGTVEGIDLLYNQNEGGILNPHDIADYAVDRFLADTYGAETRAAWLHLAPQLPAFRQADVATIRQAFPGYSVKVAEDLEDLIKIHEVIVILEGAYLKPEIVARFLSQDWQSDWRGKHMSREQYLAEFSRISGNLIKEGIHPSLASTITHMVLLNWFDRQHTGRDLSAFNNPNSWDDVSRNDLSLRYQMTKASLGELPDWITARLNRYGARRNTLLECLAFERGRWYDLAVHALPEVKVRAPIQDGRWCWMEIDLRIELPDTEALARIDQIGAEAVAAAVQQCQGVQTIQASGWVDDGAARVYQATASGAAGWTWQETSDPATRAALLELVRQAQAGDTRSMVALAQRYEHGIGLDRNLGVAHAWTSAAAREGDSLAAAELARMYSDGIGTARDLDEARGWANVSAEQEDPAGLFWRAMLDWPFNSLERFLESYQSGSLIKDMLWQPAVDLQRAVAMCDQPRYADDPNYRGPCQIVRQTDTRMSALNQRLGSAPPPEAKMYSDTVGDHMFDMRDGMQLWGATMMMDIK